jgi:hypothetical protein
MVNKRAQEEMVGFALILIIVAIIFLVLLSSYIRKPQADTGGNIEVNSFVQALMQYTTNCEQNSENLTVQKLITKCQNKEVCDNRKTACLALNDSLKSIIKESWQVGDKRPVKGYSLRLINKDNKQILNLTEGVVTNNYRGTSQDNPPTSGDRDELVTILFTAYS